jgi:thiol-disulfide isomerase/thioredoxin
MGPQRHGGKGRPRRAGPLGRLKRRFSLPPRQSEPRAIGAAFALATVALALVPLINAAPAATGPQAAPDFSITTTAASTYTLASDRGRLPVLAEFMHPDCSHCRAMGPTLETAYAAFGTRVHFVTVAIRLPGFTDPTLATVSAFATEFGHGWTYGLDLQTKARDLYHIQGTPTFAFIALNGTLARTVPGEMSAADLEVQLGALVGG